MLDKRLVLGFSSVISANSIVMGLVVITEFGAAQDTEFALMEVIPVILCLFILPNICEL